jgi:hypothetical protein
VQGDEVLECGADRPVESGARLHIKAAVTTLRFINLTNMSVLKISKKT